MDFINNSSQCMNASTCTCEKLDELNMVGNIEDFINALGPTETSQGEVKTFTIPIRIALETRGGFSMADWDPNLAVIFDVPIMENQNPSTSPSQAIVEPLPVGLIAGVVVGVFVLGLVAGVLCVFDFVFEPKG